MAYKIGSDFMNGSPIRQDYFETALSWIADKQGITIEQYMARHQHDTDANIKIVDSFENTCGKVKIVDSFEDVKVKIVDSFEDIKIKIVDSFEGVKK